LAETTQGGETEIGFVCALLCNVCRIPENCPIVVHTGQLFSGLLSLLFEQTRDWPLDVTRYVMPWLMNITQSPVARDVMIARKTFVMPKLIALFTSADDSVRHGAIGAVR
jgi:hypothetical protein